METREAEQNQVTGGDPGPDAASPRTLFLPRRPLACLMLDGPEGGLCKRSLPPVPAFLLLLSDPPWMLSNPM